MYNGSHESSESDHIEDGGTTARSWISASNVYTGIVDWNGNLKAIVELDGTSYDAVLTEEMMHWTPIGRDNKKRKSISRRGSRSIMDSTQRSGNNQVLMKDVLGVSLSRAKHPIHKDRQGACNGFIVYAAILDDDDVTYHVNELQFGHPSEQISKAWCQQIMAIIRRKTSRLTYNTKVLHLFEAAGLTQDIAEIHEDGCNLEEEVEKMNLNDYRCVVCVGGDGTVGRVTTALINKVNRLKAGDRRVDRPSLRPCPLPLGIIPAGTMNQTAHSVMGTDDVTTAVVHILLGNRCSVDVFSVHDDDRLVCWSYFAHYGFFAHVLNQALNYTLLGEAKIEASVMAVVRKFRCQFDATIQYKVSDSSAGNVVDSWPCRQECRKCTGGSHLQNGTRYRHPDDVRPFKEVESSSESCASLEIEEIPADNLHEKELSESFISASVMCMSGLSSLSPLGMSKYTHLSDGYMDVVLVNSRTRKDFVRYLKRMGKSKNQLALPAVQTMRCKEVKFHFSKVSHSSVLSLDDENQNSVRGSASDPGNRATDRGVFNPTSVESSDDDDDDTQEQEQGKSNVTIRTNESPSHPPDRKSKKRRSLKPSALLGTPRNTNEYVQRRVHGKRASKWNINNQIHYASDLSFRVHSGLIEISGLGVSPRYSPSERKMPCLAFIT